MRIPALSLRLAPALLLGLVSFAPSASAASYLFGSYVGSSSGTYANGPVTYGSIGGSPVTNYNYPGPFTPIGASTFVTAAQGNQPPGVTDYFTTFTGNLAGDSGFMSVQADDGVTVLLNGHLLGTIPTTSYDTVFNFGIPVGDYINGQNVFEFDVTNTTGYTGVDFVATATTPEPGSLALLGTGVLGTAGFIRRRLFA